MDAYIRKRARAKAAVTRVETFLRENEFNIINVNEYSAREIQLSKALESYTEIQDIIEDEDETQVQDRIEFEKRYFSIAASLKTTIQKLSSRMQENAENLPQQSSPRSSSQVKLPNVNIPTFSGKYEEWNAFMDLYIALIDQNVQLSNVQKFVYLKSSLKNEPLNIINDLQITNENYKIAIELLKKRYDNKLIIINSHIKVILDTPSIIKGNSTELREFLTQIRQHLNALRALQLPVEHWDLILIYILSQKLDFHTHKAFELQKSSSELPNLTDFLTFLEKRCLALETVFKPDPKTKPRVTHISSNYPIQKVKCIYCKLENHTIYKCTKFSNLSDMQKRQFVQNNKLCFNCFGTRHGAADCKSSNCRVCSKKHHTLLHKVAVEPSQLTSCSNVTNVESQNIPINLNIPSQIMTPNSNIQDANVLFPINNVNEHTSLVTHGAQSQVLLATASVILYSINGEKVCARALLDSASQTTFITADLVKRLKIKGYNQFLKIAGITNKVTRIEQMVDVVIESSIDTNFRIKASCAILEKITCPLPHSMVDTSKFNIPKYLQMADPLFYTPSQIDMLLGADLYFELLNPGLIRLGPNLPVLQNSALGWLIGGPVNTQNYVTNLNVTLFSHSEDVNELIPKFWQLEELSTKRFLSPEDKVCEKIFLDSTIRVQNGSFQVNLPLVNKTEYTKLGNSYNSALRRYYSLEKRLLKDTNLFAQYKDFIDEYVTLGHGKYIPFDSAQLSNYSPQKYFLPHHCVLRESSATTKLRVVFDASMKTTTGVSLNDIMLKGFPVQPELFDILCRFRTFKYVLIADVQKMYRQILINPTHRHLQNILWREKPTDDIKCIELQTVTYGTKSAPYLATRCLVQLANDESINYPLASKAILSQCYVDDILAGADSVKEVLQLRDELVNMLNLVGFKLHKWCSNEASVLKPILQIHETSDVHINKDHSSNKVLGISWNPHSDEFKIAIPLASNLSTPTKRYVLSCIAQMFDPLGLIGPVVVIAKILMQRIWSSKIDWDDQLPTELTARWNLFAQNLLHLSNLTIPRYLFFSKTFVEIQLHGYSDASLSAYGAALYLRAIYSDQTVSSTLLCSKSRIAPLKTVSLPRLELCGAVLLARLTHRILSVLSFKISKVILWTDSQIVLCWINASPSRWTTFVANRF